MRTLFQKYVAAFGGLPKEAWLLSAITLVNRSGTMVLFFMALYVTGPLGYDKIFAGQLISIYGIGSIFGTSAGGWLSDRLGPFKVQGISLFLNGIALILLGQARSPEYLMLMMFLVPVAGEAFRPANASAIGLVCAPELRARGFALNRLAINIGVTVGPAVGGFLARVDYSYLFWVDGLTCIAAAVLLAVLIPMFRQFSDQHDAAQKVKSASPWKDRYFLILLSMMLVMGMVFVQLFNAWPLYLRESFVLTEERIGILLAINALLVSLVEMPLVHRFEKKPFHKIMATGALFLFAGFAVLPLGNGFLFAALTVVIWSIGEMLVFPIFAGFIANRATDANRGSYMGMFMLSFSFSFVIGPGLGVWIMESFGADTLWLIIGLAGLIIAPVFLFVGRLVENK